MNIAQLLHEFIDLLQEENEALIESIKNKEASQRLYKIIDQKERLLQDILSLNKEDIEPFKEELEEIDHWTHRNKMLAVNNMEFINELLEAIYSQGSPSQYTKDGSITSKKEGFFNKKV